MTPFSSKDGSGGGFPTCSARNSSTRSHPSEERAEKMPRSSALKDREPLLLNPLHALVELLLCNHPFEKVSDELLALRCKRWSSLIDGIRLQDVPTPVTLLLPKSFPYDGM